MHCLWSGPSGESVAVPGNNFSAIFHIAAFKNLQILTRIMVRVQQINRFAMPPSCGLLTSVLLCCVPRQRQYVTVLALWLSTVVLFL